jgi:2'-hydroxyisoflavone reductase
MRVLVLGGTTFFGRDLVRELVAAGDDVSIFTRGTHYPSDLPDVRRFTGDRNRAEDLKKAAGPWDCVIDNVAFDGAGVRTALAALKDVGRYVLTSTVSVYRFVRERHAVPWKEASVVFDYQPADETPSDIHWAYARGKLEAERAVRESKLPWTVLRPTVVYGPNDPKNRGFWYLERMRRGGPILLSNGGAGSFRLAYSLDVAKAISAAARSVKAAGKVYNLAQEEIVTLEQFLKESARALGVKPELVPVPYSHLGETLAGPHGTLVNVIPDTQASRELGVTPTPFSVFAEKTALWFQDHWQGDRSQLLENRPQEIAFAESWTRRGT